MWNNIIKLLWRWRQKYNLWVYHSVQSLLLRWMPALVASLLFYWIFLSVHFIFSAQLNKTVYDIEQICTLTAQWSVITRLCLVTLRTFLEVLSLKSHSTDEVGQQDHQSQQLRVLQFFSSCFCIFCEVLLHVKVNLLRIENFENYGGD